MEVHGHKVMKMMLENKKEYTKDNLVNDIEKKFGKDARFYTCSAADMDAKGIMEFLEKKGKFLKKDKGFVTDKSKICNH